MFGWVTARLSRLRIWALRGIFFAIFRDLFRPRSNRSLRCWQRGAALAEFVVVFPALALLGLGLLQTGLIYHAKNIVTYATFEAARKGSVSHADTTPMLNELGLRIAPLFGGDGSPEKAMAAIALGTLEANDPRYTSIEVLNPTSSAFDDFGVTTADGVVEIPNDSLRYRARTVGTASGVSIQDANLLKIKVTYAHRLKVPLLDRVIPAVMSRFDPENIRYYQLGRIPVTAFATLRMQSPARIASISEGHGGAGSVPGSDQHSDSYEVVDTAGQGSAAEESSPILTMSSLPAEHNESVPSVNPLNSDGALSSGSCDQSRASCNDSSSADFSCASGGSTCPDAGEGAAAICPVSPGEAHAYGSATFNPLPVQGTHTGNPINLVTGNKFQQETDISALSGKLGLSFRRYYNSTSAGLDIGLGSGWRHHYQLQAQRHKNGEISVKQADGRRVVFYQSDMPQHYAANVADDGWLEQTNESHRLWIWHRRNGIQLSFDQHGLFVRAEASSGERLTLTYTGDKLLRQVKDDQGRQLTFEYYPNKRLKHVYDPAGERLRYRYDDKGRLSSMEKREGNLRQYHYEDERLPQHLTGITDERGIRYARWAYDSKGRGVLSEHADGVGKVTLEYGDGQTSVTNSEGITSTYTTEIRNGIPLVTKIQGPGCNGCADGDVSYTYNDWLQLTSMHQENGIIHHYRYDAEGRLIRSWLETDSEASSDERRYFYSNTGTQKPYRIESPSVNPDGVHAVELLYNDAMLLISFTEQGYRPARQGGFHAIQRTTRLFYNQQNQLIEVDGPRQDLEDVTLLSYDHLGRLQAITGPDGNPLQILQYDDDGRPLEISHNGLISHLTYNVQGKITELNRYGRIYRWQYNALNQLVKQTDAKGRVREFEYDNAGRLVAETDQSGNKLVSQWDDENQLTSKHFSSWDGEIFSTINLLYDIQGRLKLIDENGQKITLEYSDKGRSLLLRDINDAPQAEPVTARFSALGQLQHLSRGDFSLQFRYQTHRYQQPGGRRGKLTSVTVANNNSTTYQYDDFGRLISVKSPDSGQQWYEFDDADNLTVHYTATGDLNRYSYDAANRLVSSVLSGETHSGAEYSLTYDQYGRITELQGPSETALFTYNDHGDLTRHARLIKGHKFDTAFGYHANGQLATQQLPSGRVLRYHRYDENIRTGQLQAISEDGLLWDRTLIGELHSSSDTSTEGSWVWGNGLEQILQKDFRGRIIGIQTGITLGLEYRYDEQGNIIGKVKKLPDFSISEAYSYDNAGRLSQVFSGERGEHYTGYLWDAAGNRISRTSAMAETDSAAVARRLQKTGSTNEIIDLDITHYDYHAGSNRLEKIREKGQVKELAYNAQGSPARMVAHAGTTVYEYNSQQRPVTVYQDGQLVAEYSYNGWGERVSKTVHSGKTIETTYYLYQQRRLIAEANEDGRIIREYLYHNQRVAGVWQGGEFFAVHTDHLGTPQVITDEQQRTVWLADYRPFGKAVVDNDPDRDGEHFIFPLRQPGQIEDPETGTYYNYFRDYDPSTGRYRTSDPIGLRGGLNTYLYAEANPLKYSDPLGLAPLSVESLTDTFRVIDTYAQASMNGCHEDSVYAESAFYYLGSGQRSPVNILHRDTVDQLTRAWFAGEITEHRNQQIVTFRPDASRNSFGVFYADLSADSVRSFGNLIYEASTNNSLDTRMVLTLKGEPSAEELGREMRAMLGNLVTAADVQAMLNSLRAASPELVGNPDAIHVIDIAPLHQEIMARFQTKLMSDERVINAEARINLKEQELRRTISQFGNLNCRGQGNNARNPGCAELRDARNNAEEASEAFGGALAEVFSELLDAGDMPVMDALEEGRRPIREMFAESSLALISLFVPLSLQDAAIDAASYGLGRIRRVGELLSTLTKTARTLPARSLRFAESISERIRALRANNAKPVEGSPDYRHISNDVIEGPDGQFIRDKNEDFQGQPVYKDEDGNGFVFGAEGRKGVPNTKVLTKAERLEIQKALQARVDDIRADLPKKLRGSGNVGVAQIDIPELPIELKAHSRVSYATDKGADGFVHLADESDWVFKPMAVDPDNVRVGTSNAYTRQWDTEFKILNDVALKLGDNRDATGSINLFTERLTCTSCTNVIFDFKDRYPNIQLNVFAGE